jgi:hypothetical protein
MVQNTGYKISVIWSNSGYIFMLNGPICTGYTSCRFLLHSPIPATEFFKMVQYRLQISVKGFSTGYSFLGNGAMQAKYLSYMV